MDSDANSRTPVAESDAVSGFQIGIVIVGISITLPLLYSAGELAQGIGLSRAITASIIGALILSIMSLSRYDFLEASLKHILLTIHRFTSSWKPVVRHITGLDTLPHWVIKSACYQLNMSKHTYGETKQIITMPLR